jgi:hypothetical protein
MKFQYASSLFLELRSAYPFHRIISPGRAPILCLVGDIGSPYSKITRRFLEWCVTEWDHVLWIPGYKELIHPNIPVSEATKQMDLLATNIPRVQVLNNRAWKLAPMSPYLFLGSPLLSFPRLVTDTVQHTTVEKNASWLDSHISEAKDLEEKVIALTYSPPIKECISGVDIERTTSMKYYSLPGLIRSPVIAWIVGDMHECIQYISPINKVPILSNSWKGFGATDYNPCKVLLA